MGYLELCYFVILFGQKLTWIKKKKRMGLPLPYISRPHLKCIGIVHAIDIILGWIPGTLFYILYV